MSLKENDAYWEAQEELRLEQEYLEKKHEEIYEDDIGKIRESLSDLEDYNK